MTLPRSVIIGIGAISGALLFLAFDQILDKALAAVATIFTVAVLAGVGLAALDRWRAGR